MKYIVLILIAYTLHAQSCYTVQLMSRHSSDKNRAILSKNIYDSSCKLMEIGKSLTVRCGCYENIKDAKEAFPHYKKEYKQAYIAKTYKSRFDKIEPKKEVIIVPTTKQPLVVSKPIEVKKERVALSDNSSDGLMSDVFEENMDIPKEKSTNIKKEVPKKSVNVKNTSIVPVVTVPVVLATTKQPLVVSKPIEVKKERVALSDNSSDGLMSDVFEENMDIPKEKSTNIKKEVPKKSVNVKNTSIVPVVTAPTALATTPPPTLMNNMYSEDIEEEPILEVSSIDTNKVTQKDDLVKDKKSNSTASMSEMPLMDELFVEDLEAETTSVPFKKKHKKKHKKKYNKNTKETEKNYKYVKRRAKKYNYNRYLDKLQSKKGQGRFDYRYRFGAQLSYDLAYIDEASASYHSNEWRRIRVFHQGSFFDKKLFYEFEYSFTGQNKYKDNLIGYEDKIKSIGLDYRVKFGNIKIPFSLDKYSSSKNITFMERAISDAYADSRKFGAELLLGKKFGKNRINFFASTYSNSIDEKKNDNVEQPGYSTRLTYSHKFRKNHLFSVGGAFGSQNMKGEAVKYNQTSESQWMNNKYVKVKVKNVDTATKQNIEAIYIYDKYSFQSEYSSVMLDALKGKYNFDGYYLQGSYFLRGTGKRYKLSNSTLSKIKPNREGAIELAFRYSYLNLNDKDEQNGEQTDYTFGLNWYINSEIRFFLNYTIAMPKGSKLYDGQLQIIQSRILFAF